MASKGFLQIDTRYLRHLLEVFNGDVQAVWVYLWIMALSPGGSGILENKERTLAARAGLGSTAGLRAVLNRMAAMRMPGGAVIVSFDNAPGGKPVIRVKEISGLIIRRGVPGAKTADETPAWATDTEDNENLTAKKQIAPDPAVVGSPPPAPVLHPAPVSPAMVAAHTSKVNDNLETAVANLAVESPEAVVKMRDWFKILAAGEAGGFMSLKVQMILWTTALRIANSYRPDGTSASGESVLLEAIKASSTCADLTADKAARYLEGCARRTYDEMSAGKRHIPSEGDRPSRSSQGASRTPSTSLDQGDMGGRVKTQVADDF